MPDGAFNSLTIGRGQVAIVDRSGLSALPPRRDHDDPLPAAGVALGGFSRQAREVVLTVGWSALTDTEWRTRRDQVIAAFAVSSSMPYTFDQSTRQVWALPTGLDCPEDWEWPGPQIMGTATTVLLCPDPRIYGVTTGTVVGSGSIPNAGSVEAPFRWVVVGAASSPTLTRTTGGTVLRFDGAVGSGDTLAVDLRQRTATLNGADVWHRLVDDQGRPALVWGALPGGSAVTYSGGGTSTVTYWSGVWL